MRKIEIEIGDRLHGLVSAWTVIGIIVYVVEKVT